VLSTGGNVTVHRTRLLGGLINEYHNAARRSLPRIGTNLQVTAQTRILKPYTPHPLPGHTFQGFTRTNGARGENAGCALYPRGPGQIKKEREQATRVKINPYPLGTPR
jgi:hypothetical protein